MKRPMGAQGQECPDHVRAFEAFEQDGLAAFGYDQMDRLECILPQLLHDRQGRDQQLAGIGGMPYWVPFLDRLVEASSDGGA